MAEETPKQTTPEQGTTAPTGKKKKEKGKEKCKRRDLNPRVRTHYDLNVTP